MYYGSSSICNSLFNLYIYTLPVNLPVITQLDPGPMPVNAERGEAIAFMCNGTGLGVLEVTWTTTAANSSLPNALETLESNSITSRLSLAVVDVQNGGLYTCKISNEAGSTNATAGLYIIPDILTQPFNISTMAGIDRSLDCLAIGFPEPSYLWEKLLDTSGNGETSNSSGGAEMEEFNSLNVSSQELNFKPVGYEDFGVYRCVVSNAAGILASHRATVTGLYTCIHLGEVLITSLYLFW